MSEKRFHLDMELVPYSIVDLSDGTSYPIEDEGIFEDVVKLLNEIETERIAYRDKFENCKRNCVAVKKSGLNDEQQATIRKLQDLCGKSDGENMKLRIENKRLQEENMKLKNKLNKEYIKEHSIK